ncbi:hypothetical protein CERSUDRAFT_90692 [Gelatoporia subvermispora B]|uniref:Uncharacterized protein n=1 Tax=Ceriporiopsis subvermispora (strain B) TaxID=914234 RepID=M2QY77_CERS8|nr:hypothetical protein CERSUDRAFT_90692 [Gelatoporia subvermispora B]
MQAFHNDQPPYYPQQAYAPAPAGYYPQFNAYPPYIPPQQNVAFPVYPTSYEQPQHTPAPRRKHLRRNPSSAPPNKPGGPLKSAMKKPDRSSSEGIPLTRANSLPRFVPEHVFFSIHSTNEFRMENIAYQSTLDGLREHILPMWPPGVALEDSREHRWRVQFMGNPWSSAGTDFVLAQRLMARLFTILASQGYTYQTTVNVRNRLQPPRLIFTQSEPDLTAEFFTVTFSKSGHKLSILDAPIEVTQDLGASLRKAFPRRITSDRANEEGVHVIEVKRGGGYGTSEVDKSIFTAYVLQFLKSVGYNLSGSVPLGKKSGFGLGSRKDVWFFRGTIRRPESRQEK